MLYAVSSFQKETSRTYHSSLEQTNDPRATLEIRVSDGIDHFIGHAVGNPHCETISATSRGTIFLFLGRFYGEFQFRVYLRPSTFFVSVPSSKLQVFRLRSLQLPARRRDL